MKTRVLKMRVLKTAVLSITVPFSSLAMAHNDETAGSVVATLAHLLASPDHLLAFAGVLLLGAATVVYGPSLYRVIRQKSDK